MDFSALRQQIHGSPLAALDPLLTPDYVAGLRHGDLPRWQELLSRLPQLQADPLQLDDRIVIGSADQLDPAQAQALHEVLEAFIPWRKGPFELFGTEIDAEWRCHLKWERFCRHIDSLQGRRVLDVGSGNGYYGLRMAGQGAELVVGIEPYLVYVMQFQILKHYLPRVPCHVIPVKLEELPGGLRCFDTVFSMGVLYHQKAPIDHLLQLHQCLRPGGQLVLETLIVDGERGYSLSPQGRYARMPNVWFVPSCDTVIDWLEQCGFRAAEVVDVSITTVAEQRQTRWMPFDSLPQALVATNPELTIEGLPAPRRAIITCYAGDN